MGVVLYSMMLLLSKLPSTQNFHRAGTLVDHCSVSKSDEEMRLALTHGLWVFTLKKKDEKTLNQTNKQKKPKPPQTTILQIQHPQPTTPPL